METAGFEFAEDCGSADWAAVAGILKEAGMAYHEPELHRLAFNNSRAVVFAYRDGRLAGFARAISDGAYQAALYDVAVKPQFQGGGLGSAMVRRLLAKLPGCSVILYASPGKEAFYSKLGFSRMLTGMAFFKDQESMRGRGFIE